MSDSDGKFFQGLFGLSFNTNANTNGFVRRSNGEWVNQNDMPDVNFNQICGMNASFNVILSNPIAAPERTFIQILPTIDNPGFTVGHPVANEKSNRGWFIQDCFIRHDFQQDLSKSAPMDLRLESSAPQNAQQNTSSAYTTGYALTFGGTSDKKVAADFTLDRSHVISRVLPSFRTIRKTSVASFGPVEFITTLTSTPEGGEYNSIGSLWHNKNAGFRTSTFWELPDMAMNNIPVVGESVWSVNRAQAGAICLTITAGMCVGLARRWGGSPHYYLSSFSTNFYITLDLINISAQIQRDNEIRYIDIPRN